MIEMPQISTYLNNEEYDLFIKYGEVLAKEGKIPKATSYHTSRFILLTAVKSLKELSGVNK
jgi:hypothetical protein